MDAKASQVMRTWFERVWNQQDNEAIDELFAADGVVHGLSETEVRGPVGFRRFFGDINHVFKELKINVVDAIDDGERCYVRCEAAAIYRGEPLTFGGGTLATVRDGQIVEARDYWDFIGMLAQMRSLPKDAFQLALAGRRFQ